jgi:hypothetical protein
MNDILAISNCYEELEDNKGYVHTFWYKATFGAVEHKHFNSYVELQEFLETI